MAQADLSHEQRRALVQILAKRANLLTPLQRHNFLEAAGLGEVVTALAMHAETDAFAQQLVRVLQQHGTLEEAGRPALVSLLEELREIVKGHEDEAAFVDELLAASPASPLTTEKGSTMASPEPMPSSGVLRQLLNAAFSDQELMTLCFDYFRPVYDSFALGMSKPQKIQLLLDHCERNDQNARLLQVVQRANPAQYRRYIGEKVPPPVPPEHAEPENRGGAARDTVRVLFLASNPRATSHLRLDEEMRTIAERLREAKLRDRFELKQGWAVRTTDLSLLLLEHRPHLVHFAGHGTQAGESTSAGQRHLRPAAGPQSERGPLSSELVLEDPRTGEAKPVPADVLADLFRILKDDVQCVLLNACWSAGQARALVESAKVPVVVGMTKPVGDPAAIAFAAGFYRALGFGRSLNAAFELGRNELSLTAPAERETPALLTAPDIDAASLRLV